jgi:isopentenyldiphosphate isomerase
VADELFETFDDAGRPMGLAPRRHVHAAGLWHRSVHVLLFDPDGALYIQQRAPTKDVYPGRWDLTVGEHLEPGEAYLDGALRGLREELGVTGVLLHALGDVRPFCCDLPALGILDCELQATFSGVLAGGLEADGIEVTAVRAISAGELGAWIARDPEAFTPWFLEELRRRPGLGAFRLEEAQPDHPAPAQLPRTDIR